MQQCLNVGRNYLVHLSAVDLLDLLCQISESTQPKVSLVSYQVYQSLCGHSHCLDLRKQRVFALQHRKENINSSLIYDRRS